jgi:hypothetical protein
VAGGGGDAFIAQKVRLFLRPTRTASCWRAHKKYFDMNMTSTDELVNLGIRRIFYEAISHFELVAGRMGLTESRRPNMINYYSVCYTVACDRHSGKPFNFPNQFLSK